MARAAVMQRGRNQSRGSESSGNGYIVLLTLSAMLVSLISMYSVIIVLFGMLPGLIAMIIDQESRRYISKIVLTFNATGVFIFLAKLFSGNASNDMAIEMIINPQTWMVIYLSASVGWIIYWAVPQMAVMLNNIRIQFQVQKLDFELQKLTEEWGGDIKSN